MNSIAMTMAKPRKSLSKRSLIAKPFKIGQLDGSAPRQTEIRVVKRKASIELIAEQYQALLESRDADDDENFSEEDYQHNEEENAFILQPTRFDPSQNSPAKKSPDSLLEPPAIIEATSPLTSPASSSKTLIDFEQVQLAEDAIYFRPISFPTPNQSPQQRLEPQACDKPLPMPPPPSDQPLQACVALLVEELTSVLPHRRPRAGSTGGDNTQALQINTMIEAYERVRDQLPTTSMAASQQNDVRALFDCWLTALHTMHRSYSGGIFADDRRYHAQKWDLKGRRVVRGRGLSTSVI